ncbi:DUF1801 domain-containing protein [Changchengzhania lutea]|uniref:DUF1801 domain-containing protein n=1 Tax=Changchengzhania lutea TaxID=2049305 RepID=UPI00115EA518|nr:DUF1801 domain-containing protein [Changchengzhania lutea]
MDVLDIIDAIDNKERRLDCLSLLDFMKEVTNESPQIWRSKLIGFGSYHYKYKSGTEGDWFLTGFSSTKQHISIYIVAGVNNYPEIVKNLGEFKSSTGCLYVKKLSDINLVVLKALVVKSMEDLRAKYSN